MKVSIIIPVYNEEKTIINILVRVTALTLPNIIKEIIIVNDGSSDKTQLLLTNYQLQNKKKAVKIITHEKNYGKGMALRTGIKHATGEYIVIQDADAEYNPIDISRLLQPIQNGKAQVVYGTRLKRMPHFTKEEKSLQFFVHYAGNKFLSLILSILYGYWITDMETGYKIFPRKALIPIRLHSNGFEFEAEITAKLLKSGYRIKEIPIKTIPRSYGEGKKLRTIRDGSFALIAIIKYRFTN